MNLYDWVVLGAVSAFAARGWVRGFIKELVDVAILVAGSVVVFRVSAPVGTVLSAMANVPYEAGRIAAGVVMLGVLLVGGIMVANIVTGALRIVPGATIVNRLGGLVAGVVYGAIVVVLVTTVLSVGPMPDTARSAFDDAVQGSVIGSVITEPDGGVQQVVGTASGESLFRSVLSIRQVVGDRLAAGTLPIPLPTVTRGDLVGNEAKAKAVLAEINVARVAAGQNPLVWSQDLAVVAEQRAVRVYLSGSLSLDDRLDADLTGAAVPGTIHSEGVAIGASPAGVAEAIIGTPPYREAVENPAHRRAGIGVVEGPYGDIAVFIVSG